MSEFLFITLNMFLICLQILWKANIIYFNIQLTCRVEVRVCQVSRKPFKFCQALNDVLPQWKCLNSVSCKVFVGRPGPILFYHSNHFLLKPYWTIWKNLWPLNIWELPQDRNIKCPLSVCSWVIQVAFPKLIIVERYWCFFMLFSRLFCSHV